MNARRLSSILVAILITTTAAAELYFIANEASHGELGLELAARWRRLSAAYHAERHRRATFAKQRNYVIFDAIETVEEARRGC